MRKSTVVYGVALLLVLVLAACVPQVSPEVKNSAAYQQAQKFATIVWHRMELGHLQSGTYSTNVLADLKVPQGVKLTLVSFGEGSYLLRVTSSQVPGVGWFVSPSGVEAKPFQASKK
jgi:hypothetical protein